MVAIAQLVERQIVVLDVAGSSPVSHPDGTSCRIVSYDYLQTTVTDDKRR